MIKHFIQATCIALCGLVNIHSAPKYHAAGILPYAYDTLTGEVKVLLGVSSIHNSHASDFGGLRDKEDHYSPAKTAAREACEELMFIFDSPSSFKRIVRAQKRHGKHFDISQADSHSYKKLLQATHNYSSVLSSYSNGYRMYFIPLGYDETLLTKFAQRYAQCTDHIPNCWNETTELVWLSLSAIYQCIDATPSDHDVHIGAYTLYAPFVSSLRAARDSGIIDHITRSSQEK